jgi:hypothetical protein
MRRTSVALVACVIAVAGAALAVRASLASDHLDGPRATADPQADVTDVFAFTSPENPRHVVLAMAVAPFASASATFSDQVEYVFRVQTFEASHPPTLSGTDADVTCTFEGGDGAPQTVTCVAPNGLTQTSTVGDVTGGGDANSPMRVFAGFRSDPAFFDRQGAAATLASGRASFTGTNAYAGANVLALVVELDAARAFTPAEAGAMADGGALPMIAVAAETNRRAR